MSPKAATRTYKGVEYPVAPMNPPKSLIPKATYWAITQPVAKSWLKRNSNNRSLREQAANAQLRDMACNDWDLNGETLIFSRPVLEGEVEDVPAGQPLLNDGQHRLKACADGAADGFFVTLVSYGVEPDTRRSVDSGAARTMKDVLKMEGEVHSPIMASLLRRMLMWDEGDRRFNGSKKKVTKAECSNYLKKDPQGLRRAAEQGYIVRNGFRLVPPTIVAQAYYLTHQVAPEETPWFFARLADGTKLETGDPILALRNRFQSDRLDKKAAIPHQQLAYILNAWNAYREGRSLERIQQPPEAPVPMPK